MTRPNARRIAIALTCLVVCCARLSGKPNWQRKPDKAAPANRAAARVADSLKRLKTAMGTVPTATAKSQSSQSDLQEMIQRLKSLSIPEKPVERGAEIVSKSKPTTRPAATGTDQPPAVRPVSMAAP